MKKLNTPLGLITIPYFLSFFSGVFGWDFTNDANIFLGISQLVGIIWCWTLIVNSEEA